MTECALYVFNKNKQLQANVPPHPQCELWKLENICAQSENFVVNALHPNQRSTLGVFKCIPHNIALFYTLLSFCLLLFDDFTANALWHSKSCSKSFPLGFQLVQACSTI